MYDPLKRPRLKRPKMAIPWGFVSVILVGIVALSIFGSWGYVAFS